MLPILLTLLPVSPTLEVNPPGATLGVIGGWPVEERIFDRLPVTLELGVMAILIGLVIALPVGIYSAIRQDTAADYAGALLRHHRPGNA